RYQVFRLRHVWDDLLRWLDNAARQSCERERCPHHLHEVAARERGVPVLHVHRKLALDLVLELSGSCELLNASPILLTALRKDHFTRLRETFFAFRTRHRNK